MTSTLANLWARRDLLRALTVSNLKKTHQNTVLGYLWWLLDPILMTAVYTVVIGIILKRGGHNQPYPAFAMCGLLSYRCFSASVSQAIDTISQSENLIKSFNFPKAVLPISVVLCHHVLMAFALVPLMALALFYEFIMKSPAVHISWTLVVVPVIMLVQLVVTMGCALLFSCFGVFFKDLGNLMTHVLRVVWYLSPGLYSIANVIKGYQGFAHVKWSRWSTIFVLNPFAHVFEGYRYTILYGTLPDFAGLAYGFVLGVILIALGMVVFRSQERKFAKLI